MVLIVTGYGTILTPEMEWRLNRTVALCNHKRPDIIIFTGGYTQASTPWSEAQMMARYVGPKLTYNALILLEKKSLTTLENFFFCRNNFVIDWRKHEILVDYETTRRMSVKLLGLVYFRRLLDTHTTSWMPKHFGLHELALLTYNVLQLTIPGFTKWMRETRIRRAKKM